MVTTDKVTVAEFAPHIGKTTTDYKENDMGVYIANMEMPKECKDCQWHLDFYIEDEQVGGLCTITEKDDKENICPLTEIDLVRCGECKYFNLNEWDETICGVPIIVAHEICHKWGDDGHQTSKDGFCFMGERRAE